MKNIQFAQIPSLTVMLLIDILDQTGGAERSLYLLAKGLKEHGHKVIVCCLKGGELAGKIRRDGFSVEELNLTKVYDFKGIKAFFKMLKIIRKEKVSLLMSYHESSDYIGLLLAGLTRIPIVSSRRDMGFKLEKRHIRIYHLINFFFDQIATVSSAVKEVILNTQGGRSSNIMVIPNGVDLSINNDRSSGSLEGLSSILTDNNFIKVCCLANLRPIKGHHHLIDAVHLVVEKFPNVRVFLVGKFFEDNYCHHIERQVKELKLERVIHFVGELPHEHLGSFLSQMDISVLSSLSEGMSNALLESMVVGKPVIATAVGGNLEVVENGKTGYLVPPGDPQSMADALLKLLTHPELRCQMGQQGRYRVESLFSVNRMVERYQDLLRFVYLRRNLRGWLNLNFGFRKAVQKIRLWTKFLIASIFYYSGLITVFRWIKRLFRLNEAKILCFHDISESIEGRSHYSIFIPSDYFTKFLDFLAQTYQVVSLEEAIRFIKSGNPLTKDVFSLTFDDSYKGWMTFVLPECKKLHVPLSIFLATDPLDSSKPLLYDALVFLAENTWRKVVDLSSRQLGIFLLKGPDDIFNFVEKAHEYWRGRNKEERNHFLQELSEYLEVPLDPKKFGNFLINWDDVHTMDMEGVTIGAHSASHPYLPDLEEAECFREVYQSKKRLEEELGRSVPFFAYPYGGFKNGSSNIIKIVEQAGFFNAFTLSQKDGNSFQPFEIGRRSVSQGMLVGPNGKFCKSILAMELCGLGDLVFGRRV